MKKSNILFILFLFCGCSGMRASYISDDELNRMVQSKILFEDIYRNSGEDEDDNIAQKDEFLCVSLGFNCATAFQLGHNKIRRWSFPFDWNISSMQSVSDLIENDFLDFLNPTYLDRSIGIFNNKYRFSFAHDFPVRDRGDGIHVIVDNHLDFLEEIRTKYERRIKRFYNVCNLANTVYFFRLGFTYVFFDKHQQPKQDVIKLRDVLMKKFPEGNWVLVVIDVSPEYKYDWQIPKVKNFYISDHGIYSEWTEIFRKLGLLS